MKCRTCIDGVFEGAGFLRIVCPNCNGVGKVIDKEAEKAEAQRINELTKRSNVTRESLNNRRMLAHVKTNQKSR